MKILKSAIPSGTMIPFAGATVPSGWLLCDGSLFSRALYPALALALNNSWGNGDGATTMHLPDTRGRFLRGMDAAAARDPDAATRTAANSGGNTGDNVGSVQAAEMLSHVHDFRWTTTASTTSNICSAQRANSAYIYQNSNNVMAAGGNETRPQNANVKYIIKV